MLETLIMKRTQAALINFEPAARAAALEAVRTALPDTEVFDIPALGENAAASQAFDLVVLHEPDESTVAAAVKAVDITGASRWPVVVLGSVASDLAETVPPAEWTVPALARVFRAAVQQHQLLRENFRLRGDLKTVARRISHDLRTPAGCIHTSTDLLEELTVEKSEALANIADVFRQSSTEISLLVDRVSFVLRASADPVAPAPVDMRAIVQGVLQELEPEIQTVGATIIQPDTWPQVNAVPTWLHAIWGDLLRNALKHGGASPRIVLAWENKNGGVEFSISDSGAGVAPARSAGLFSPFEHLHAIRSTGLGLSIVHRLVSLQRGTCAYEKLPSRGSRFSFTLPA